jgi:hypothetical protein
VLVLVGQFIHLALTKPITGESRENCGKLLSPALKTNISRSHLRQRLSAPPPLQGISIWSAQDNSGLCHLVNVFAISNRS